MVIYILSFIKLFLWLAKIVKHSKSSTVDFEIASFQKVSSYLFLIYYLFLLIYIF